MVGRTEKWIATLMNGLENNMDEKLLSKILEQCGRQCQSQSFVKKARKIRQNSRNIDEFLEKLGRTYKHLHKEGKSVYIVYPRCYCSQVNKIPDGRLSGMYCNCSCGWTKALFEGALDRPVEVIKEKSIIGGDSECRFRVVL